MRAQLNIAVLGLGRMGKLYAETIATRVPSARLVAGADPDARARDALSAAFDIPRLVANPTDVLSWDDIDAVIIATPTSTHQELVVAAAGAGKAIFCEKPLALTLQAAKQALDAVERADVPLQIGFMRRFDTAYAKAHALIRDGAIGTPVTFKAVGRDPFCPDPAYADPAKSGGLIVDMAIHDFDLARWLMGQEVERVSAEGGTLVCEDLRDVGDIDNALINLRFAGGGLGNVEVSRNAFYGYDIRTEVLGSEGALTIGAYQQTPLLLLNRSGAHHDVTPYLMERFGDAYRAQIDGFVRSLRDGTSPTVTGSDGLAALAIAVAATRSYHDAKPIALAELGSLASAS
ncbi:MAG TPA: inositol 2-dehydrogenase [Thermomicrobiales bacterium]|nr:inositol 2-dehydrogenase [Thermomicrobiales bacterium]